MLTFCLYQAFETNCKNDGSIFRQFSDRVSIRLLNDTHVSIFFLDNLASECPSDCYGHGDCVDGNCRCFAGFAGWDCKESKYFIIMMRLFIVILTILHSLYHYGFEVEVILEYLEKNQ